MPDDINAQEQLDGSQVYASDSKGYYAALAIEPGSSPVQIRAAFKAQALATHPDKGGSEELFLLVKEAFEVLGNDELRAEYDSTPAARSVPKKEKRAAKGCEQGNVHQGKSAEGKSSSTRKSAKSSSQTAQQP